MNKRIGERFKLYGIGNFKGLDLEFEIVGIFPPGRYDTLAAFNRDYFNDGLRRLRARAQAAKAPAGRPQREPGAG